jgi:hypothetical protein
MSSAIEINEHHEAVVQAGGRALEHAIEAGKALLVMKGKIKAEGKKWAEWLTENCPDIHDRTARLYMRLAKGEPKLKAVAAKNGNAVADFSIRGAVQILSKPWPPEPRKKSAKPKAQAKPAGSDDLYQLLPATDADELFAVLQNTWDAEKLSKLAELLADDVPPLAPEDLSGVDGGTPADVLAPTATGGENGPEIGNPL